MMMWLICGWPLMFVSCVVAQKLKDNFLLTILFAATIIHAILICLIHAILICFSDSVNYTGWFFGGVMLLIAFQIAMIPVWIDVLRLNRQNANTTPDPVPAASTPSPPNLLGDESEVK